MSARTVEASVNKKTVETIPVKTLDLVIVQSLENYPYALGAKGGFALVKLFVGKYAAL
jgi:hypothetical protein